MKILRTVVYPGTILLLLSFCLVSLAQEGRTTFKVLEKDTTIIQDSRKIKESGSVFQDQDADGLYDTVFVRETKLSCEIDEMNAYGVQYVDGPSIVFYPSVNNVLPRPGESALVGFVHYFNDKGSSLYFAIVMTRISEKEEEAMKKMPSKANKKKSILPYQVDFIDSNGLRVGIPSLIMIPHSKLLYNADFQKFNKSTDTVLLGTNPAATNRELYIFMKIPEKLDNLVLIHYRWY